AVGAGHAGEFVGGVVGEGGAVFEVVGEDADVVDGLGGIGLGAELDLCRGAHVRDGTAEDFGFEFAVLPAVDGDVRAVADGAYVVGLVLHGRRAGVLVHQTPRPTDVLHKPCVRGVKAQHQLFTR